MQALERRLQALRAPGVAALLLAVTLLAYLPGFFSLPPVDRDETRFAQTTRQMLQTGDLIDLRFQDGVRYRKPVGIYWMQAAAVAATGETEGAAIWRYRLPSLAAAIASVLLMAGLMRRLGAPQAALAAGLLMATVFILGAQARLAKTDAVVLLTVVLAMGPLISAFRDDKVSTARALLFWAALGVSLLVKGPIGPMVPVLAIPLLALPRRGFGWLAALQPWRGLLLLLAIVLPWYVAITIKSGGAFWSEALARDLIGKVQEVQEGHGAPPGFYLLTLWFSFFPASAALALALPQLWASRRTQVFLIALACALPGWLIFELTPTKLIHYTLPFYPALAIALAAVWAQAVAQPRRWAMALAGLVLLLPLALVIAIAVKAGELGPHPWEPLLLAFALLLAGTALALRALRAHLPLVTLLALCLSGIGLQVALFPTAAATPALWLTRDLARAIPVTEACPTPTLYAVGIREASMVFESPGRVVWASPDEAARALVEDACAVAAVSAAETFVAPPGVVALRPLAGMNLGTGKRMELVLWGRAPG
ncbi:ArnT family glycosyltransferase [Xinfangfangia pollutisoli]|uniref:ArnT family glycosyltransferase n=1 Tax=Xinfangfangia pollutisoli TaxID=2865960 RepID=UPI0021E540B1|nr:glycosyltransferase family 39 protein [Xinfangfangia pollutisoli]